MHTKIKVKLSKMYQLTLIFTFIQTALNKILTVAITYLTANVYR